MLALHLPIHRFRSSANEEESQCSGRPPPCKACLNTGGCIFDETLDLRRKVAARRTQGELEYYRGLLYSLLETLRSSDEEKARQMLEKIRGNVQLNDLVTVIEAPATDFSDASSEHSKSVGPAEDIPSQHERPVVDAHLRITVEKLCDSPLFQVPSGPWTVATNDDHIVSHLISLYFTWDHPLLQVVDQEMFLKHVATKETNPDCCTSLLVNSILAVASVRCSHPPFNLLCLTTTRSIPTFQKLLLSLKMRRHGGSIFMRKQSDCGTRRKATFLWPIFKLWP